jgi:hypothetical protein
MRSLPEITDRLPLGDGGLMVSPICLGIVTNPSVVSAAYEAGINFFFVSADMHWPLYEQTRRGLQQLLADKPNARDEIVVGAVAYVTQPEFCWAPFQEVLEAVPALAGRLDLTIAGGSYGREIALRLSQYAEHRSSRFLGTRAIGASFHDRAAATDVVASEAVDLAYVRYNPVHANARTDVYASAKSRADGRRCLLYNFKSTLGHMSNAEYDAHGIGDDFWRPHVTDYYRFAFTQPAVDGVLCSLPTAGSIRELADALAKGPLDDDDHQDLLDLGALSAGSARLAS